MSTYVGRELGQREQAGDAGAASEVFAGKRTRSDAEPPVQRLERAGQSAAGAVRAGAWEMTSELESAMGLGQSNGGLRAGQVSTAQAAGALEAGRAAGGARPAAAELRFRVPTAADIKTMLAKGDVPEAKLKASIQTALERMAMEGDLLVSDPVGDIMKRLFPSPGVFDEAELAKVVDVADRDKVYQSVSDAQTKVSSTDKGKLLKAMDKALAEVDKAILDATGLKEVFGGKDAEAKAIYQKCKTAISTLKANLDTKVHTDYNRDDAQIGLGGWANFSTQMVHLETEVAKVSDEDDTVITVIHECSHLADTSVDDLGYYGSSGFEAMSEDDKICNAAHYEELPRRSLGTSSYDGLTFKPGVVSSGGAVTFEDEVRRDASEYFRKAWDKAVDVHLFLRGIRQEIEGGSDATFKSKSARILEISKLEHLTIHEQSAPSTINMNDIVLAEGVARATGMVQNEAESQPVPSAAVPPKGKPDYVEDVIVGAIKTHSHITGSYTDDRALFDWLVAQYQKPL